MHKPRSLLVLAIALVVLAGALGSLEYGRLAAEFYSRMALSEGRGVRDRLTLPAGVGEAEAKAAALESEAVQKQLEGRAPKQVIYVPGRLVNIVG